MYTPTSVYVITGLAHKIKSAKFYLGRFGTVSPKLSGQCTYSVLSRQVFALGHENRATGSTKMNIQSSRSHALLCVTVMGVSTTTGVKTMGESCKEDYIWR